MKGIKLCLVGVCVSLLGIAFASNNVGAMAAAFLGTTLAIAGCFIKD